MLLVDDYLVKPADLSAMEGETDKIATELKISLDGDLGVCRHAVSQTLSRILYSGKHLAIGGSGMTAGHLAAVHDTGQAPMGAELNPAQVVVDAALPGLISPIKAYALAVALEGFYRTASNRRSREDRYLDKFKDYATLASRSWAYLVESGLPVVTRPLPRPGAVLWTGAGTWDASKVSLIDGATGASTGNYQVAISWRTATGIYSAPSDAVEVTLDGTKRVRVSIAGLTPPTGTPRSLGAVAPSVIPEEATEWVVWAGPTGGLSYLQAWADISTGEIDLAPALVATGTLIEAGQVPSSIVTLLPTLRRM
jgi:hypothetical protein